MADHVFSVSVAGTARYGRFHHCPHDFFIQPSQIEDEECIRHIRLASGSSTLSADAESFVPAKFRGSGPNGGSDGAGGSGGNNKISQQQLSNLPRYMTNCYPFVTEPPGTTPQHNRSTGTWQGPGRPPPPPQTTTIQSVGLHMPLHSPGGFPMSSARPPGPQNFVTRNLRPQMFVTRNAYPTQRQPAAVAAAAAAAAAAGAVLPSGTPALPAHSNAPLAFYPYPQLPRPPGPVVAPNHAPGPSPHGPGPGPRPLNMNPQAGARWPNPATFSSDLGFYQNGQYANMNGDAVEASKLHDKSSERKSKKWKESGSNMVSVGVQNDPSLTGAAPRRPSKSKTKTLILIDVALQTDFSEEYANLTLLEKPNSLYQSREWPDPYELDTTTTDSEEVDSDSGYSSPMHRRNQASSGTHAPGSGVLVPGYVLPDALAPSSVHKHPSHYAYVGSPAMMASSPYAAAAYNAVAAGAVTKSHVSLSHSQHNYQPVITSVVTTTSVRTNLPVSASSKINSKLSSPVTNSRQFSNPSGCDPEKSKKQTEVTHSLPSYSSIVSGSGASYSCVAAGRASSTQFKDVGNSERSGAGDSGSVSNTPRSSANSGTRCGTTGTSTCATSAPPANQTSPVNVSVGAAKTDPEENDENTGVGRKRRRRSRRRKRKTVSEDEVGALSDETNEQLKRAHSSSNVSRTSTEPTSVENVDTVLHFEDEEEFPDLISPGGPSRGDASATSHLAAVSYSEALKSPSAFKQANLPKNVTDNLSPQMIELLKDAWSPSQGKVNRSVRKRQKRREAINRAAEEELAEISIEQQVLKEISAKHQQKQQQHNTKKSQSAITLNFADLIDDAIVQKSKPKEDASQRHGPGGDAGNNQVANILDSSAPAKRGKEREVPKQKKPSPLKKVILKEREEKKRGRLLDDPGIETPGAEVPPPSATPSEDLDGTPLPEDEPEEVTTEGEGGATHLYYAAPTSSASQPATAGMSTATSGPSGEAEVAKDTSAEVTTAGRGVVTAAAHPTESVPQTSTVSPPSAPTAQPSQCERSQPSFKGTQHGPSTRHSEQGHRKPSSTSSWMFPLPVHEPESDGTSSKASSAEHGTCTPMSADMSPISQTSPISMSPLSPGGSPLSSGLTSPMSTMTGINGERKPAVIMRIHSRRFREYCTQVLDKEIDASCTQLLQDLVRFQDRLYHKDPVKAKSRRRIVLGLREVTKHLKLRKIQCVIISPNLERIQSKGGLDEALNSIIDMCTEQNVPCVFALGRRALGRACAKLVPVSAVGVFSYEGSEDNFNALMALTEKARTAYHDMVAVMEKEVAENHRLPVSATYPQIYSHLGHSRTPSACSAISFTSSILSEPISENYPHSEPETDSRGYEIVRDEPKASNALHNEELDNEDDLNDDDDYKDDDDEDEEEEEEEEEEEDEDGDDDVVSCPSPHSSSTSNGKLQIVETLNDIDEGNEADTEDFNETSTGKKYEYSHGKPETDEICEDTEDTLQDLPHIDSTQSLVDLNTEILSQHSSKTLDFNTDVMSTHSSRTLGEGHTTPNTTPGTPGEPVSHDLSRRMTEPAPDVRDLAAGSAQKLKAIDKERIESWVAETQQQMERITMHNTVPAAGANESNSVLSDNANSSSECANVSCNHSKVDLPSSSSSCSSSHCSPSPRSSPTKLCSSTSVSDQLTDKALSCCSVCDTKHSPKS